MSASSSHSPIGGSLAWLIQSWTSNCSHAAASTLRCEAGRNRVRSISASLMSRGRGAPSGSGSGNAGPLRPNGAPAVPIPGWERSLKLPSVRRASRAPGGCGRSTPGTPVL